MHTLSSRWMIAGGLVAVAAISLSATTGASAQAIHGKKPAAVAAYRAPAAKLLVLAASRPASVVNGPGVYVAASPWLTKRGVRSLPLRPFVNTGMDSGVMRAILAYCEDYGSTLLHGAAFKPTSQPAKLSPTVISEMLWAINNEGGTPSQPPTATQGAAVAAVVLSLASAQFRSDWKYWYAKRLSSKIVRLHDKLLGQAQSLHGKLMVSCTTPASNKYPVGTVVNVTCTVTSAATRKAEPGIALRATSLSGAIPHGHFPAATNSAGKATFSLMTTGKTVGLRVAASAGSWSTVLITIPVGKEQHLLAQYGKQSVQTLVGFGTLATKLAVEATCPQGCTGVNIPVVLSPLHNTSSVTMTATASIGTRSLGTPLSIKPGQTLGKTWSGANNGDHVLVTLYVIINGVKYIVASQIVVADCPDLPPVAVLHDLTCGCMGITVQGAYNTNTVGVLTITYADSNGHTVIKTAAPGATTPAFNVAVTTDSVTYTLSESAPYATHSGARTVIETVSMKVMRS